MPLESLSPSIPCQSGWGFVSLYVSDGTRFFVPSGAPQFQTLLPNRRGYLTGVVFNLTPAMRTSSFLLLKITSAFYALIDIVLWAPARYLIGGRSASYSRVHPLHPKSVHLQEFSHGAKAGTTSDPLRG